MGHPAVRHLLAVLAQFGALGLFCVTIADSSFLFLPIGADLLTIVLIARDHSDLLLYVLVAAAGSAAGVLLLDLVCRRAGEAGLERIMGPKQLANLKQRLRTRAALVLVIACLAPPPFPFTASVAAASAFQYPRSRLLSIVFAARLARFSLLGWAAVEFGRKILRMARSEEFLWFTGGFIALCIAGSIIQIVRWVRIGRATA
jgi:membrane protein YqaA with SNARE-associated domain